MHKTMLRSLEEESRSQSERKRLVLLFIFYSSHCFLNHRKGFFIFFTIEFINKFEVQIKQLGHGKLT